MTGLLLYDTRRKNVHEGTVLLSVLVMMVTEPIDFVHSTAILPFTGSSC
jgi:hypothetical protein